MISIYNHPKTFQLFQSTKRFVVTDIEEMKKQNPLVGVDSLEEFIKINNFKKVDKESVQGYKCVIYEGNVALTEDQSSIAMKLWYSTELGYPVKTEIVLPAPLSGKIVSTLENIKRGKQSADLFEIPSGYTEAKSMQEAMGMGGFSMPAGGEMPSLEEMEKMMKSAQEMMKGMQNK